MRGGVDVRSELVMRLELVVKRQCRVEKVGNEAKVLDNKGFSWLRPPYFHTSMCYYAIAITLNALKVLTMYPMPYSSHAHHEISDLCIPLILVKTNEQVCEKGL